MNRGCGHCIVGGQNFEVILSKSGNQLPERVEYESLQTFWEPLSAAYPAPSQNVWFEISHDFIIVFVSPEALRPQSAQKILQYSQNEIWSNLAIFPSKFTLLGFKSVVSATCTVIVEPLEARVHVSYRLHPVSDDSMVQYL
ncbi:hypothetical protein SERLA73DRAFT_151669 [Serpula lacrymans var. lacrymans S7.3]|uniref:Uncharacterized protein n=1 Tax=Serpula lacrymans var. lacrymans (strain S7.3) TaxID=936435 RepID=F8PRJ6_SERL3|nr:hypothetical protein SERLA73DRAFT_151669 [Serpula lacrymans var. lacrymans S7.3]